MTYKILLLDDDLHFRKMVVPRLMGRGITVVEARNGKEASELIEASENNFDLLVVDAVLPDTDGISWLGDYKKSGGKSPVIFISGHWQPQETYEILTKELSVSQIIHKPVIPRVFAEQVYSEITRPEWSKNLKDDLQLDSITTSMDELCREYFSELPQELDKIENCLKEARTSAPEKPLQELRFLSHKLRGTAGSFGLAGLGELMGLIEDKIREEQQKHKQELPEEFFEVLENAFTNAKRIFAEKQKKLGTSPLAPVPAQELRPVISRILIVGEDHSFLDSVETVASQRLVDVLKAGSTGEALRLLDTSPIDAILIDVDSENIQKAFELITTIRESRAEEIPIAYVSGDSKLDDRLLAAHLGASLYLSKPIDPDTLEDAIQRLMILSSRQRPKILIVDDDIHFAKRASRVLADRGMETKLLNEPLQILEKLQEYRPDILILDLMMPYISGFDICKLLRTTPRWQDLPIIFVTAQTGIDTRIAAFSCGADDYLPKPMADEELVARVSLRVERSRLLKERSERDPVTGLLIRRSFMERFNASLGTAKRTNQSLSIVIFDLDNFKGINDSYGHLAGDTVLAGLGRLMLKRFRVEDIRGRWGGDEFVLAFVGCNSEQSQRLMQSFLIEFSRIEFQGEAGETFHATLSAGIASFPEDCRNTYDLLRAADQRLYEAKSKGRNCVVAGTELATRKDG